MNLSSCVADSVVLSFDSAGQTLGSGTNPSPLSSFLLSALATAEVEPNEVGEGASGEGTGENNGATRNELCSLILAVKAWQTFQV